MLKAKKKKTKKLADVCCQLFYEAYLADEISFAYEKHTGIDETEWYISGLWHLYFCPFCGKWIKGRGFGRDREQAADDISITTEVTE